jgi:hypothetical protein
MGERYPIRVVSKKRIFYPIREDLKKLQEIKKIIT